MTDYCLTGIYHGDKSEPPVYFYNTGGDFYYTPVQVPATGPSYITGDSTYIYNSIGGQPPITEGSVLDNFEAIIIPPNMKVTLYNGAYSNVTNDCTGTTDIGEIFHTSNEKLSYSGLPPACIKIEEQYTWETFKNNCANGTLPGKLCQSQYSSTGDLGSGTVLGADNTPSNPSPKPNHTIYYIIMIVFILLVFMIGMLYVNHKKIVPVTETTYPVIQQQPLVYTVGVPQATMVQTQQSLGAATVPIIASGF